MLLAVCGVRLLSLRCIALTEHFWYLREQTQLVPQQPEWLQASKLTAAVDCNRCVGFGNSAHYAAPPGTPTCIARTLHCTDNLWFCISLTHG